MPITHFENHDGSIIEFKEEQTHKVSTVRGKKVMVLLDFPLLIFNYVKSQTKAGEIIFKKHEFKNYLDLKLWKGIIKT